MDEHTTQTALAGGHSAKPGDPLSQWGPFQLLERVGSGGFGEVYRAFDPALRREVAVKILLTRGEHPAEQTASVLREARAMAKVTHPNIVAIYGVSAYDGRPGFWTAFVKGKTLSALLAANGPFGAREAIHIGVDLCRALSAVHGAGLLHRDVKAGNAMREEGGRILLMDFGLTEETLGQTVQGGTPGYIAPELLAGGKASARSDLYALGVLLYRLLTNRYPDAGAAQAWTLLESRPDLPAPLVRAIHQAMEPDPAKRFGTAAQMAAALLDADTAAAQPKRRTAMWAGAAAAVVAVAGAFVYETRSAPLSVSGHRKYEEAHDLVEHYYRPRALEKAIGILTGVVHDQPTFAAAFADLGRANFLQFWQLRDAKYVEPAKSASTRAIEINPNLAAAHVTLGMLYTQMGNNDLALQELDLALASDRSNPEAWAARAELYSRQGRGGDVEPALRKAIDLSPLDWRWQKQLGDYFGRDGRWGDAILADREAVRLAPDNARALNNMGTHLIAAGQFREAEKALRASVTISPGFNAYSNLGTALRYLGDLPGAEQATREAIALNSADYRPWALLAELYGLSGKEKEQMSAIGKSIGLAEELQKVKAKDPVLLADLAEMHSRLGDTKAAAALAREAVALAPDSTEVLYQGGCVYERIHFRADAVRLIVAALRKGYPRQQVLRNPELAEFRKDADYLALTAGLR